MILTGTGILAHGMSTMLDKNKGSMTNRFDCAKEHVKNDTKTSVKMAVPVAALAGAAYIKHAKPATKMAQVIAKMPKVLGQGIGKFLKALKVNTVAEKVLKNPTKAGVVGLSIAAGFYAIDTLMTWANKKGKIDQKYEDAAKIESQTKNIVLEAYAKADKINYDV